MQNFLLLEKDLIIYLILFERQREKRDRKRSPKKSSSTIDTHPSLYIIFLYLFACRQHSRQQNRIDKRNRHRRSLKSSSAKLTMSHPLPTRQFLHKPQEEGPPKTSEFPQTLHELGSSMAAPKRDYFQSEPGICQTRFDVPGIRKGQAVWRDGISSPSEVRNVYFIVAEIKRDARIS